MVVLLSTRSYRDYQILVQMQLPDGTWAFNEIQVNLRSFVALKDDKTRGHGAFDTARMIQAFTAETVVYTGGPSPGLWENVAAGMFLALILAGSEATRENMAGAPAAVRSENCRLDAVSLSACGAAARSLAAEPDFLDNAVHGIVTGCGSLRRFDLGGLRGLTVAGYSAVLVAVAAHAGIEDGSFTPPTDPAIGELLARFGVRADEAVWDLHDTSITEADCADLAKAMSLSTTVTEVKLQNTGIGDPGAVMLAPAIAGSKTIESVDLSANSIGDPGAAALAGGISKSTSLQKVDLSRNKFSAAGWTALTVDGVPPRLSLATLLERHGLKLGNTGWGLSHMGLADADCVWIAVAISKSTSLRNVDLGDNSIGDTGTAALAGAISKSTSLQSVSLEHNSIGDTGAAALAGAIPKSTSLWALDLRHNSIGDTGAAALADSISTSTSMQIVDLRGNTSIGRTGKAALAKVKRPGLRLHY